MPIVDYVNTFQRFEHSPSSFPNGSNFILSDITRYKYQVKFDLAPGETSFSGLRVVIRYGQYSYENGQPTPIAATFDFPYTGGIYIFDLGIVPSSWGYFSNVQNEDVVTMSFYVRVTDGSGTYYSEMGGHLSKMNYYKGASPERFNVSRNVLYETELVADYKVFATSIKEWSNPTEYNSLQGQFQYYNGTTWVNLGLPRFIGGIYHEGILNYDLPFLADISYNIRLVLTDKVKQMFYVDILPTASVPLSLGKTGIGVGKIWEKGALDIFGESWKNGILQPTIFRKKETDPDPDGMVDGDVLIVYNELEAFASANFPQVYGTGYVWGQVGTWPTDYLYWTSTSSITNSIVESIESSSFKGDSYPHLMFNNNTAWNDNVMFPAQSAPITMILHFKGTVQFNSFTLWGWAQGHEVKNSPKSFAFFGSNDGHEWTPLYDTTAFTDTYNSSASGTMTNTGLYFEYLKMVWRTNQDNNSGNLTLATLISFRELTFDCSGYRYV